MTEPTPAFDWENSVEYKLSHRDTKRPVLNAEGKKISVGRKVLNALFGRDAMEVYDHAE